MRNKGNIAVAVILIALGVWFLTIELYPPLREFVYSENNWPLNVIGVGVVLAVVGLVAWVPGLMIPASIVTGIGGLLYWQNATNNWESWAYAWTLIPVFVGIGIVLTGLLSRERKAIVGGAWTIFNGLVLLVIFGAFLGGGTMISTWWPALLIVLGVILLSRGLLRRR